MKASVQKDSPQPQTTTFERQVPAVVVIAAASAMLGVGVIAVASAVRDKSKSAAETPAGLVDRKLPENVAESFLDAWRKRHFREALDLSRGEAQLAVREKMARGEATETKGAEVLWEKLAAQRLKFVVHESENASGARLILRGVARGEFLGKPYSRNIEFVLMQDDGRYWVEAMHLGTIEGEP